MSGGEKSKNHLFKVIGHYLFQANKPVMTGFDASDFCHRTVLQFLWVSSNFLSRKNWNPVI